jgi:hypothetical protein
MKMVIFLGPTRFGKSHQTIGSDRRGAELPMRARSGGS